MTVTMLSGEAANNRELAELIDTLQNEVSEVMRPTKELQHGQETLAWLHVLKPDVSWHVQLATFAHDIERADPNMPNVAPPLEKIPNEDYLSYKGRHAKRSAVIVKHLMETLGFESEDIMRVYVAVESREVGGNDDADLVRDADSLRWFDVGWERYFSSYGLEGAVEKAIFMYERMSDGAKELVKDLNFHPGIRRVLRI